jgi:hypothetical protein
MVANRRSRHSRPGRISKAGLQEEWYARDYARPGSYLSRGVAVADAELYLDVARPRAPECTALSSKGAWLPPASP